MISLTQLCPVRGTHNGGRAPWDLRTNPACFPSKLEIVARIFLGLVELGPAGAETHGPKGVNKVCSEEMQRRQGNRGTRDLVTERQPLLVLVGRSQANTSTLR